MANPTQQPPPTPGPETAPAKPAEPGPKEPPNIATSILPERQRDAARHPEGDAIPPEAVDAVDDAAAAAEHAAETEPRPKGRGA